ncbi:D-beta-hydroxybutyrate dehydrogenase [Terricaulis silvestris]|uniref:D-beta-hydroxybutyrate dehydrogenase n=2 Tax=Terricaulis silvestris TaxID=2686094 RepID=A0A6I6MYJ7_9CAUL|nr:D-beta-hydroxybutyrate dehydrogenase [Terricaulis silvestris]
MQGKTVVITGGGGVLGSAVGRVAEARGATVVLVDVTALPEGPGLRFGHVDLTNLASAKQAMDEAKAKTGRLDALLNIAGGFRWQTLEDGDLAGWDVLYNLNVKTAATACKAALPHLLASGDGRIVNVGAAGALKAAAGMGAYAASKAGVMRLTESLAEELKGRGVTVNAVLPSIIDTPANRKDMPDADFSKWVTPDDLAAVMLFLASAEARAITGALVPVVGQV